VTFKILANSVTFIKLRPAPFQGGDRGGFGVVKILSKIKTIPKNYFNTTAFLSVSQFFDRTEATAMDRAGAVFFQGFQMLASSIAFVI